MEKFPERFSWILTDDEWMTLRSKISTLENKTIGYDNTFHDRYFLIDNKDIYHCEACINRIGYKTFSINYISDKEVCNLLFNKVNKII